MNRWMGRQRDRRMGWSRDRKREGKEEAQDGPWWRSPVSPPPPENPACTFLAVGLTRYRSPNSFQKSQTIPPKYNVRGPDRSILPMNPASASLRQMRLRCAHGCSWQKPRAEAAVFPGQPLVWPSPPGNTWSMTQQTGRRPSRSAVPAGAREHGQGKRK